MTMTRERALAVLEEVSRRKARPWEDDLFDKQKLVVEDKKPVIALHPGRRGGKTHTLMAKIFSTMKSIRGQTSVYLALTRGSAKRIMWEEMKRANQKYDIGFEFREVELTVKDPYTGSICILGGADDAESIERLRGGKYALACIDECGSFNPDILAALVREVIRPALGDLRGQMVMAGTPSRACFGMFHDLCNEEALGASVHHWTVADNPFFPNPREWLEEEKRINKFTDDSPIFAREYLGKWVQSTDSLVSQFSRQKNLVKDMPSSASAWRYVLGIDYGFKDSTAFSLWAFLPDDGQPRSPSEPSTVCVRSFKKAGLTPGEVASLTNRFVDKYQPDFIVGDAGGLGKGYIEETKLRYGIPIRAAKKTDKRGAIELMNGDFRSGQIVIVEHRNLELIRELETLPWKDERREEIADGYEDHIFDAAIYAWRECRAWMNEPYKQRPKQGSREWAKEEEKRMWEEHDLAQAKKKDAYFGLLD
jgi:hypothetical protein